MGEAPASKVVLIVEDHPRDVELARRAFAKLTAPPVEVHVAVDGVDAMSFLRRDSPRYAASPRPDLILLDLHMPRKDGRAVLREVKGDPTLRQIPVVIFTTSADPADVRSAYELFANAYVAKPVSFTDFNAAIAEIASFWFATSLTR